MYRASDIIDRLVVRFVIWVRTYVEYPEVLYVVGFVSVGFWGSIDRISGIVDARKIPTKKS